MKTKLICMMLLIVAASSVTIFSCKKQDTMITNEQDINFFKRDELLKDAFSKLNGSLTDETLLNKVIAEFKDYDKKKHISQDIITKFGKPKWDISIVVKNKNGFRTIFTPIANEKNEVTSLAIFYQNSINGFDYKIVTRKTSQTKLPEYGDKEGKTFTKATLLGLFDVSDKNLSSFYKTGINAQIQTNSVANNSYTISWVCWLNYSYGTYADGTMYYNTTGTQCSYTIVFDYQNLLAFDQNDNGGGFGDGGGNGQTDPYDFITYDTIPSEIGYESCSIIITHHSNGLADEIGVPYNCQESNLILNEYNSIKDHTISGKDPYFKLGDISGNPQMICPVLFGGVSASFSWEKADGKINITQYSTALTGFSPCLTLTFQNGSPSTTNGDVINFSINSILTYSLVHPQVLPLKSKPVRISGTFETKTGNFTLNVHS